MVIFQYRCLDCDAVFDHALSDSPLDTAICLLCGGNNVSRNENSPFSKNKKSCPEDSCKSCSESYGGCG